MTDLKEFLPDEHGEPTEEGLAEWNNGMVEFTEDVAEIEKTWGFERLDQLAEYFLQHEAEINKVYPNWSASIQRYKNTREQAVKKFAEITDPFDRYEFLLEQVRQITLLKPRETGSIYQGERRTGRFAYQDSLLKTAMRMYRVPIYSNNDNPDRKEMDDLETRHLFRQRILSNLTFGAKKPNETSGMFKKRIHPLKY